MSFHAKLNVKFYITAALLCGLVLFGGYGIYFLNANRILMEDHAPMPTELKLFLTVVMGLVVCSWGLSLCTMIRQILLGHAFRMDERGIHATATAMSVFAFILVIPVREIPYSAIQGVTEENGVLTLRLDRSKIKVVPWLKPLVRREFHLFFGFTKQTPEEIKGYWERFMEARSDA